MKIKLKIKEIKEMTRFLTTEEIFAVEIIETGNTDLSVWQKACNLIKEHGIDMTSYNAIGNNKLNATANIVSTVIRDATIDEENAFYAKNLLPKYRSMLGDTLVRDQCADEYIIEVIE